MTLTKSTSQQDPSAGGAGSAGGPVARQEIPVSNVVEAVAAGSSDEEDEEDEAEVDQVCSPTEMSHRNMARVVTKPRNVI